MNRVIYILLFIITSISTSRAQVLTICDSGCNYSTVSKAVKDASPYDTLLIKNGIYKEFGIVVDKPLTILGEDYPVIDAEEQGEIIRIESDNVTINGLEIKNVGISYVKDLAGINVVNSKNCKIINNKLTNTFFGIYLQKSRDCLIRDNIITGEAVQEMSSGNAIHLWYCKNIDIINNSSIRHRDGIYLEFVDSSRVKGNLSKLNVRYGMHFMFSNYDEYHQNTFEENGSGVAVMFSKYIDMTENKFINNWGPSSYGLLLKDITDSKISHNIFNRNTSGIYAESATRIDLGYNDFINNGWAIKMLGSSMYNNFHDNNLIGNTIDLTTNAVRNTNTYTGNYWSNYSGYDMDNDGFGDIPYKPVQLFSHIIGQVPEAIVLVRSPLVDLLNFVEKTTPVFTPEGLEDNSPAINRIAKIGME